MILDFIDLALNISLLRVGLFLLGGEGSEVIITKNEIFNHQYYYIFIIL